MAAGTAGRKTGWPTGVAGLAGCVWGLRPQKNLGGSGGAAPRKLRPHPSKCAQLDGPYLI
jgi:hypothetical protein